MLKFRNRFLKISLLAQILILLTGFMASSFADGLPGEYYVTPRWRDLFAGHSPATNPAFMTEENYVSVRFALCPTLQASFFLMEGGAIVPVGLFQSIGFSYLGVHPAEDIEPTEFKDGKITKIDKPDLIKDNQGIYILSYAINPVNRLSVGINLSIHNEANFGDPKTGFAGDLGLTYRLTRHPVLGDHVFGLTLQNFQKLFMEDSYSSNFKVSWLAKLWEKRIDFGIDLDIKDFAAPDFAEGTSPKIEFDFNSRFGFWILRIVNAYVQIGNDYLGGSIGMNVPTVNNGRDLQFMYQYMNITDGTINSTHTIYVRSDFGKHREEIYARKMARLASIGPGDLYNKAKTLYSQGKYWDALFIFGKITVEYPDFFKNDDVRLHASICLEELDMREFSAENYNETKKLYPRSVVIPFADLGLLRLHYRDDNHAGVANQFSKLNTSVVPDSLKYHAYYYMAQTHIKQGNHQKAIQLFDLIPENHPEYVFAQHSLGVAYALSDNLSMSIEAFDNSIQIAPKTPDEKDIINRSYIFLGYIYYEGLGGQERALSKAISALRKVPKTSYFYEDALLGIAWTALRASQWIDCITACRELITLSKKPVMQCEAGLLEGYCYMMDKKYPESVTALSKAFDKIEKASNPSESEKSSRTLEYDNDRGTYYEVAAKVNELAFTSQSSYVLSQIDSLRSPQKNTKKKLTNFYNYCDEFTRRSFFARNIENVRNDLEYALAKAEKMAGGKKAMKTIEKAQDQTKEIDQEMIELEKQLKSLEEGGK